MNGLFMNDLSARMASFQTEIRDTLNLSVAKVAKIEETVNTRFNVMNIEITNIKNTQDQNKLYLEAFTARINSGITNLQQKVAEQETKLQAMEEHLLAQEGCRFCRAF